MERPAAPAGARSRIVGAQQAAFAQQMARLLADMAQDAMSDLREVAPAAGPASVVAATPPRQDLPPAVGDGQAELADDTVPPVAVAVVPALLPVHWVAPATEQAVPPAPLGAPAGVTAAGWSQDTDRAGHAPSAVAGAKAAEAAQVSCTPQAPQALQVPQAPQAPQAPPSGPVAVVAQAAAASLVVPAGRATLSPRPAASAVPSASAVLPGAGSTVSAPASLVSALPGAPGVGAVAAQPFSALATPVPAAVAATLAQSPATPSWTGAVLASATRQLVPLPSTGQESGPAVATAADPAPAAPVTDADPRMALGWASGLGWLPPASHLGSAAAAVSAPFAAAAPALPVAAQAGLPEQLQLQINLPDLGPLRLDMQLDASGQAQLLLQTGSAALAQTLGEHTHQLVDAMRELGLVVQVDVRHDGTAAGGSAGSGGQPGSQQGGFQSANQGPHAHRQAQSTAATLAPAAKRPAPAHPDNALSYYA